MFYWWSSTTSNCGHGHLAVLFITSYICNCCSTEKNKGECITYVVVTVQPDLNLKNAHM